MIRRSLAILFVLTLLAPAAQAVNVEGLYQVTIPVTGQNAEERQGAIRAAFSQLLVRLTGHREILYRPSAVELLGQADQYVQQYRYGSKKTEGVDDMGNSQLMDMPVLTVVFDAEAVDQALWKNRLPVWGRTRPGTLVWVAVQDGDERYLLDANSDNKFMRLMREAAESRGLPLIFPLMDLQDQVNVSVSDVWGNFEEPILRAATRYDTEAVLVGKITEGVFGGWEARWHLYEGNDTASWSSQSELLDVALSEGVEGVADHLGAKFAQVASEVQAAATLVAVSGVTTLNDYVRTLDYLTSLAPVSAIAIESVEPSRITFKLDLRGSVGGLQQAIALGSTLSQDPTAVADGEMPVNAMGYTLLP